MYSQLYNIHSHSALTPGRTLSVNVMSARTLDGRFSPMLGLATWIYYMHVHSGQPGKNTTLLTSTIVNDVIGWNIGNDAKHRYNRKHGKRYTWAILAHPENPVVPSSIILSQDYCDWLTSMILQFNIPGLHPTHNIFNVFLDLICIIYNNDPFELWISPDKQSYKLTLIETNSDFSADNHEV
jgi:hypothetical protein